MEYLSALLFYLVFSLFAAIGLPVTSRLGSGRLLAAGAAKTTGFMVFGYSIWLLSSLRLLDFQNHVALLTLFSLAVLAGLWTCYSRPAHVVRNDLSAAHSLREFLCIEAISVTVYMGYLFARSHNPAADGTEHFMDMALLSSSAKTHSFPFIDPWHAGAFINYYYYGSYLISLLSNLGGIPYQLSYNLALGLIYCQSVMLAGTLAFAVTGKKTPAALAAFLVTSGGTLFYASCTIRSLAAGGPACSYPSSTRLYSPSYIINEIPSYSFTVGNLHAHLLALPFLVLALILLYLLAAREKPRLLHWLLYGLVMATLGMSNPWDLITAGALLGMLAFVKVSKLRRDRDYATSEQKKRRAHWILGVAGTLAFALILMLPRIATFSSPVMGIGFSPVYVYAHNLKNVQYPTPALALMGMWGVFAVGISLSYFTARRHIDNLEFLLACVLVSAGIIVGVELFFIRDVYSVANPPYFRANTTFKFGYAAWVVLSITFAGFTASASSFAKQKKHVLAKLGIGVVVAVGFLAGVVYPIAAVGQYYMPTGGSRGLDASSWIQHRNPEDWEAIQFINRSFRERTVIAEAVGDSYTYASRMSAFTGMITPMGWQTHEWTWRFSASENESLQNGWASIAGIVGDMKQLYETMSPETASTIIDRYGITHVYVGGLERSLYPALDDEKFRKLGSVVFELGRSRLFRVVQ